MESRRSWSAWLLAIFIGTSHILWGSAAAAENAGFAVSGTRFVNLSVFEAEDFSPFVSELIAREEVTLTELEELADRVTQVYREHGYLLAFAYVPPQEIIDGVVDIVVVEGRYSDVLLENESLLLDPIALSQLGPVQPGALVHQRTLNSALNRLNQTPGVRARAVLGAGADPGTAELTVKLEDERRVSGAVSIDNFGNPHTGRLRKSLDLEAGIFDGYGDILRLHLMSSTQGLLHRSIDFVFPPDSGPARWSLSYTRTQYELGGEFTALEAQGTARQVGFARELFPDRTGRFDVRLTAGFHYNLDFSGMSSAEADSPLAG